MECIKEPEEIVVLKDEFNFRKYISENNVDMHPLSIETLQVNITKMCNQACRHCHVDSSPLRREEMDLRTVDKCLEVLKNTDGIKRLDLTGGAPELSKHFRYFVEEAKKLNKHVMVRHNLTVMFDPHPVTGESNLDLPDFFAENKVEIISSMPYYQEYLTDKQRGKGVFSKSIDALKLLNAKGYGNEDSDLILDLVCNPIGAYLPAAQCELKSKFKKELFNIYGITFNDLFVLTNMPINRFEQDLKRRDGYSEYMTKLVNAFNPSAAEGVMCRSMISVGHDGKLYDCDFNQMIDMTITNGNEKSIYDFDFNQLLNRKIKVDSHCFGCTAGAGSSCSGETA